MKTSAATTSLLGPAVSVIITLFTRVALVQQTQGQMVTRFPSCLACMPLVSAITHVL